MDEEIERLVVSVRADTSAFARDVASMRGELEGPLVAGAGRAGRMIDGALATFAAMLIGFPKAGAHPHSIMRVALSLDMEGRCERSGVTFAGTF